MNYFRLGVRGSIDKITYVTSGDVSLGECCRVLNGACSAGRFDVVKMLCNIPQIYYADGLYFACKNGNMDIINYILIKIIHNDSNIITDGIFGACIGGNLHIVKYLLTKYNILVNWNNALRYAYKGGNRDTITYVMSHISVKLETRYILDILESGYVNYIDDINRIMHMNNMEKLSDDSVTSHYALRNACASGKIDVINYVLHNNCDVNWNNGLSGALSNDHFDIAKLMIEKGNSESAHEHSSGVNVYSILEYPNDTYKIIGLLERGVKADVFKNINGIRVLYTLINKYKSIVYQELYQYLPKVLASEVCRYVMIDEDTDVLDNDIIYE